MKNGEVLTLYETLEKISRNKELKFNVKLGYIMARNKEKLRQEALIIYEQRRQILMEYGTFDKNGDIIVPKDSLIDTNKKINELLEIENKVEIDCLPIDVFEEQEMNMEDIEGLMPMLYVPIQTGPPIFEDEKTPE